MPMPHAALGLQATEEQRQLAKRGKAEELAVRLVGTAAMDTKLTESIQYSLDNYLYQNASFLAEVCCIA